MLQFKRFEYILDMLEKDKSVKVTDIANALGVSESTIRRDIVELDSEGRVKKVFGGAVVAEPGRTINMVDVNEKASRNREAKRKIAEYAASLICKDDFVYIDAGTTTTEMLDFISERDATYVTNGVNHALVLARKGFRVQILSGGVNGVTEAVIGADAVEDLQKYYFTKSFIGVDAIDVRCEITTPKIEEGAVKHAAIKRSKECYLVADRSKFDTIAAVKFAEFSDITQIITDRAAPKRYLNKTNIKELK